MAYIRQHGRQLELVHGVRSPESGQVEQRVLLTFYSKKEALDALGEGAPGADAQLRKLLALEYPELRFDWNAIAKGLRKNLEHLPDRHDNERQYQFQGFGNALALFARELWVADPFRHEPAAALMRHHRDELEVLQDLIRMRLAQPSTAPFGSEVDPHGWRFAMSGRRVPPEVEEFAIAYWEKGNLDKARATFQLLVRAFDDYAEGHNYLGLIALRLGDLETARREFRLTVEVGRRLFPRRIAKSRYWSDLETRPFMRGLRNLALVQTWVGQYESALEVCDRLERECGDELTATWQRAAIYLNQGRWIEAMETAERIRPLLPDASLIAAFACYELGNLEGAASRFLHAALNELPEVRECLAHRSKSRRRVGIDSGDLANSLRGYLQRQRRSVTYFATLLDTSVFEEWIDELKKAETRWHESRSMNARAAFDKMETMRTPEFAEQAARSLPLATLWR